MATGCAGLNPVHIDPFKIHAEIPFLDGAESVWVDPITQETGEISSEEWEAVRPEYLMIHIDHMARLLGNLYAACRFAGEKCNVYVRSSETALRQLEGVIKKHKGK